MAASLPRRSAVYAAVMSVLVSLLVWVEPSVAVMAPSTLADRKPVQAGPVQTDFPIDYLGVLWDTPAAHGHADDHGGAGANGAVRFRHEGVWGRWVPLVEDGVEAEGRWASGLVHGGGAEAYQVRGVPAAALDSRAVAINTTDGPLEKVGERRGGAANASATPRCQSRAEWGADEAMRFTRKGDEIFEPTFHEVQALTVHHTATLNGDENPAATVRAIYRYHAVDNRWGDIGYQYLVDEDGVVYEGRWSGEASTSCLAGGDGSEFAHETGGDRVVTGAHTGGWNSGNVGVALLGDFTTSSAGADPAPAALGSLENLLVDLTARHGLTPQAEITYANPVSGETKVVDTIGGHRDYMATECPGERLYGLLPDIRDAVAATPVTPGDGAPTVSVTSPSAGDTVSGVVTLAADATDDVGVSQVAFSVDGAVVGTDTDGSDGWTASWDTGTAPDAQRTVTAVATDTGGRSTTHSVTVTVMNGVGTPGSVHVGDLDGTVASQKSRWTAGVEVTVVDGVGAVVGGALVSGAWTTTGTTDSCTTGSDGTCSVSQGAGKGTGSLTFVVDDVKKDTLSYAPDDNDDPDGDSDGTTITVVRSG
ncbi:N-acetylmuramoyl-L-alanine amidase [Ornithinimicrobium sp. LYQ103]|uniref:N-acetylmuramoyl-L-alanine amidase n=1 Tax=Ornithinimicrobium sp. LYQ103 TaxID=3378796 RepID=UPI003855428F